MFRDYYLRTTDYAALIALGLKLGVIMEVFEDYHDQAMMVEGVQTMVRVGSGEPVIVATGGGLFDYIGTIPPSSWTEGDPEFISDNEGTPYIHANLRTPFDIRGLAEGSEDPDVQVALGQISNFFVTDESGEARAPHAPHRVFA